LEARNGQEKTVPGTMPYAVLEGRAVVSDRTKQLSRRLDGLIAVIRHEDLDETAAEQLAASGVLAVINAARVMTGVFPHTGPLPLVRAGIPIYEVEGDSFPLFREGEPVRISGAFVELEYFRIPCRRFGEEQYLELSRRARAREEHCLDRFAANSLVHALRERKAIFGPLKLPPLGTAIRGRHVLVVARGGGCRKDLAALSGYIQRMDPVRIGVDGGADTLLDEGWIPHLIVGDMDSVSDRALFSGAELVVHAYPDGTAPGLSRINKLQLPAHRFPVAGTSEDAALLLADAAEAEFIVGVGMNRHMGEFLGRGRRGMGSTLLTRMRIADRFLDARGISGIFSPDSAIPADCAGRRGEPDAALDFHYYPRL